MKLSSYLSLSIILVLLFSCGRGEEVNSIPSVFLGDWIEIGELIDNEVNLPSELSVSSNGFKKVQYNDEFDATDKVIFNVKCASIFKRNENSILILNDGNNNGRFIEVELDYSDGVLYLVESMSTGIKENGTLILGGGNNLKFVRVH